MYQLVEDRNQVYAYVNKKPLVYFYNHKITCSTCGDTFDFHENNDRQRVLQGHRKRCSDRVIVSSPISIANTNARATANRTAKAKTKREALHDSPLGQLFQLREPDKKQPYVYKNYIADYILAKNAAFRSIETEKFKRLPNAFGYLSSTLTTKEAHDIIVKRAFQKSDSDGQTGQDICDILLSITDVYDITNKVTSVICDSTSNNIMSAELFLQTLRSRAAISSYRSVLDKTRCFNGVDSMVKCNAHIIHNVTNKFCDGMNKTVCGGNINHNGVGLFDNLASRKLSGEDKGNSTARDDEAELVEEESTTTTGESSSQNEISQEVDDDEDRNVS